MEIRPQVAGILLAASGARGRAGQTRPDAVRNRSAALHRGAGAGAGGARQAHAALAQAERDLARARPLTELDAISQKELDAAIAANDSAQSQVKAGEAAVKTAELNLGYTKVRSPSMES